MSEEYKTLNVIVALVCAVLITLIAGGYASSITRTSAIVSMVKEGADPIVAACAVRDTDYGVICAAAGIRK